MRILFTNAPKQYYHITRFFINNVPVLNLPILAATVRDNHQVKIFDNSRAKFKTHNIWRGIKTFNPDVVCISNNCTSDHVVLREIMKKIKRDYPHVTLILGGQYPSRNYEQMLQTGADYVVRGEGESTFKELIDYLANSTACQLKDILGIAYKKDSTIISTPDRPFMSNLDDSPMPDWELLEEYPALFTGSGKSTSMELSRGCVNACSFCEVSNYWKRTCRKKSIDRILQELDLIKSLNINEVFFIDDNFGNIFRPAHVTIDLFKEIIRRSYNFKLGVQITAEDIVKNEEIIELMAKAGLSFALVGFESFKKTAYEKGTKDTSFDINVKASELFRKHNIFIMGSHAYANPQQSEEDLNDVAKYGQKYSDLFKANIYTPLGVDIMHKSAKRSYKGKLPWEKLIRKFYLMQIRYFFNRKTVSRMFFHKDKLHRRLMRKAYMANSKYVYLFVKQKILRINS